MDDLDRNQTNEMNGANIIKSTVETIFGGDGTAHPWKRGSAYKSNDTNTSLKHNFEYNR